MGPTTIPGIPDWASEYFEKDHVADAGRPPIVHAWDLVQKPGWGLGQRQPAEAALSAPIETGTLAVTTETEVSPSETEASPTETEASPCEGCETTKLHLGGTAGEQPGGLFPTEQHDNSHCSDTGTEGSRLLSDMENEIPKCTETVGWGQFQKRFGHMSTSELLGQDILIVGGGLTSAHLCHRAASRGCNKVTLVSRRKLKVKQFDLDLKWLGWRHRPTAISNFLSDKDLKSRLNVIREARGGGSVTPEAHVMIQAEAKAGRLDLLCDEVIGAEYISRKWHCDFESGETRQFDQIWLATGSVMDATKQPILSKLLVDCPIDIIGGLPALHPSLRWRIDCPVFVMGAFAALQLGPDALNLGIYLSM
jgi:hypothetical protein